MADLFADTSGWGSWADSSQLFHLVAMEAVDDVLLSGGRVVTTSYVLAELVSLLTRPLRMPRPMQIALLDDIRAAPWVEIIHIDPGLEASAWQLWAARPDKEWSLIDCASFVVMQQRGFTEALTSDQHFEQAGFIRILK